MLFKSNKQLARSFDILFLGMVQRQKLNCLSERKKEQKILTDWCGLTVFRGFGDFLKLDGLFAFQNWFVNAQMLNLVKFYLEKNKYEKMFIFDPNEKLSRKVFIQKRMFKQFRDGLAFFGLFLEAAVDEVFAELRDRNGLRKVDLLGNHLVQVLVGADFERDPAAQKFVRHDADVPDVDFGVVLFLFDELGRGVDGGAAERVAGQGAVDGPAEVAYFYDALKYVQKITSWKRIFSGLRSLWMMSLLCMNSSAQQTCRMTGLISVSVRIFYFLRWVYKFPEQQSSSIKQMCDWSEKNAYNWTMFGWSRQNWIWIQRMSWTMTCGVKIQRLMTLRAQSKLLSVCLARQTVPVLPQPIYERIVKSLMEMGLERLMEDFRELLLGSGWGVSFFMFKGGGSFQQLTLQMIAFQREFSCTYYYASAWSCYFFPTDIFEHSLELWLMEILVDIVELRLSLFNLLLKFSQFSTCFLIIDQCITSPCKSSRLLGCLSSHVRLQTSFLCSSKGESLAFYLTLSILELLNLLITSLMWSILLLRSADLVEVGFWVLLGMKSLQKWSNGYQNFYCSLSQSML